MATVQMATLTFYGWPDNDPPHSAQIAYPSIAHPVAGGTGTFKDPITAAAPLGLVPPGTKIWIPSLRAYVIVEDICGGCTGWWLDVWVGGQGYPDSAVIACEDLLTPNGKVPVEANPPSGWPVRSVPLFNGTCHP